MTISTRRRFTVAVLAASLGACHSSSSGGGGGPVSEVRLHGTTWTVQSVEGALATLAQGPIVTFRPHICTVPDGTCMLYPGDAGYDDHDPERAGPRHRLWALPEGMRYERDGR